VFPDDNRGSRLPTKNDEKVGCWKVDGFHALLFWPFLADRWEPRLASKND
jgi:hypothetical protein